MSVTVHFQSTGRVPGSGAPVPLKGGVLTLGRGPQNDLVLPDPDRVLSKRHCVIEERGEDVVAIDLSTNGTFLNYARAPLGPEPKRLHDGDILVVGPYELRIAITAGARIEFGVAAPSSHVRNPDRGSSAGDDLDDILGADDGGDFLDDLLGPQTAPPAGPSSLQRAELGDDGLLPPLGVEEAALPGTQDVTPDRTVGQHSAAIEDSFRPPSHGTGAVIPDDWEDLLAPARPAPRDTPPSAAAPVKGLDHQASADPLDGEVASDGNRSRDASSRGEASANEYVANSANVERTAAPARRSSQEGAVNLSEDDHASSYQSSGNHTSSACPEAASSHHVGEGGQGAARAFLEAAGAGALPVAEADLVPTMRRMGVVLRTVIHGLREILMTRASIKSEFRIQQTMIASGNNNPLKFSISPEQALEAMIKPTTRGYLEADAAAEQALQDIKAHEVAMMSGMEAALKGILARLSPEALETQFETSGGLGSLLKGRKARYWEVYEKMYGKISDQAENEFHELFAQEFARAYQDQLERLK